MLKLKGIFLSSMLSAFLIGCGGGDSFFYTDLLEEQTENLKKENENTSKKILLSRISEYNVIFVSKNYNKSDSNIDRKELSESFKVELKYLDVTNDIDCESFGFNKSNIYKDNTVSTGRNILYTKENIKHICGLFILNSNNSSYGNSTVIFYGNKSY